jgi:asparagine synthase (glutamine-hydrolysing)
MCGIAGVFALAGEPPADGGAVGAMTAALAHRGPDDCGSYAAGPVSLGFRRLSLVDPAHGGQPHRTPDESVVSVCNGEIFNHRELRNRLSRSGHRFRSGADTEVLVHLYQEHGAGFVGELDGQFGFALYDTRARRLLLARDRCGIVPLFYTVAGGQLIFASEIKAVLAHPLVRRAVDLRGLDQALALPGLVSPRTMFEGIRAVRPGEVLVADAGGIRAHRYWDLDYPEHDPAGRLPESEVDTMVDRHADVVRTRLEAGVRSRLVADVPVGLYLSGGLDSSLIGALATGAEPQRPLKSFAVTFPGEDFDESAYQRLVAAKLGTDHHEVPMRNGDFAELLRTMVRHAEMPVRESYNVCSLALSRQVREAGVTAVLSGEGADELFGGYPGYRFDACGFGGDAQDPLEARLEREISERMWGVDLRYEQAQLPALEARREVYSPDLAASLDEFAVTGQRLADPARLAGRHPLHQRSYLDFKLRLADHLLGDHGDRMAMANGVELRFPFLANGVLEHARTMPAELMVAGGLEKAVLRRAAPGLVPAEVLGRTKFGFRGQTSTHLLRDRVEWFEDLISPSTVAAQGYFDPVAVTTLARRQREGSHQVHPHLDTDFLLFAATFALFVEEFELPCLR